jgi:hypothetical protein
MKMQSLKYVYRVSLFFLSLIVTGCYSMTTEDQSQEEIMTPVKLGGPWFVEYIEDRPVQL